MAFFIAVLKRMFCVDDDHRSSGQTYSSLDEYPRLNSRQFNSEVRSRSIGTHHYSLLRQEKSQARDVVFGANTYKSPSIPKMENTAKSMPHASLSRNVAINSIKSESPKPPLISAYPTTSVVSSSSSVPRRKKACIWVEHASSTNEAVSGKIEQSSEPIISLASSSSKSEACIWVEHASSTNEAVSGKIEQSSEPIISLASSSSKSEACIWVEHASSTNEAVSGKIEQSSEPIISLASSSSKSEACIWVEHASSTNEAVSGKIEQSSEPIISLASSSSKSEACIWVEHASSTNEAVFGKIEQSSEPIISLASYSSKSEACIWVEHASFTNEVVSEKIEQSSEPIISLASSSSKSEACIWVEHASSTNEAVSGKIEQSSEPIISLASSSSKREACIWVEHASSTNEAVSGKIEQSSEPIISLASSSSKSDSSKNKYVWVKKAAPSTLPNLSSSTNQAAKSCSDGKVKLKSLKPPPLSAKPIISLAPSSTENKNTYIWIKKSASSSYVFPKEIKSLIEKDIVPGVLKMPLSKSSYKDYFHALLYAEDCYLEKWDGFEMKDVKVKLQDARIYTRTGQNSSIKYGEDKDEKLFVEFELDKIRERRPFLISRDFVSLQPTNQTIKPFQGVICRVWKSNLVVAEFGQEFYSCHHPDAEYDVKFSFNRVCLKRAHQATAAASESLFNNLLFPNNTQKYELPSSQRYIHQKEPLAVAQILRLQGLPPYLVEGPLAAAHNNLSKTGEVVIEAIIRILCDDPSKKILVCAPMNRTCDVLMRGLKHKKEIAESEMFRANAAFRERDGVPEDILPSCLYTGDAEYFVCPEFAKLKEYKVISTTFMSSYRLYGEGIMAGHFSHIFVVDASSATEPEAMVPLANFVTAKTVVVVTGAPGNRSGWIRSRMARENGLMTSYFERLSSSAIYPGLDEKIMVLEDERRYDVSGSKSAFMLSMEFDT